MSILLALHIFALGFVACLILLADKEAFAWFRGKRLTLESERLHQYHVLTWSALLALTGTGILILYPLRLYLLTDLFFITKLFFVCALVVNAILIGRLQHIATLRSYASLSLGEKLPLMISGVVSTFSWVASAVLGYIVTNM